MSEAITRGSRSTSSPASMSIRPVIRGPLGRAGEYTFRVAMPSTASCGDRTENGRSPGTPVMVMSRVIGSPNATLPPEHHRLDRR